MPTSRRRPPLPRRTSTTSALAPTHEQRATPVIEIGFGERQRFLDAQAGSPEDQDQAT